MNGHQTGMVRWMQIACLWFLLAGFNFPEPQGSVSDFAGVIEPGARAQLEDELRGYRERTGNQVVVVTVLDLQGATIDRFANELFNTWGVGHHRHDNGVMLLYAPNAPQGARVRIEVGRGLEMQIPDSTARNLIETEFRPRARGGSGDRSGAVVETAHAIVRQLGSGRTSPPDGSRTSGWTDFQIILFVCAILLVLLLLIWAVRSRSSRYGGSSSSFFFFDSGGGGDYGGGGDSGGSSDFGGGGSDGGGGSGGD
jgi:uncharacterized protein